MKKIVWAILLSFTIVTWSAPGHAAKTPYKIGVNLELTGPWAEITKTLKNGMVMEVEKINAKGGINGRPL
ncbi:MAG: ABC transporter substrate-binding protein, partial [Deltaproteobacteria bacterium]|nr:ABC transporter substrate-binding protein [Deltaproteobacteria bacterium]